MDSVTTPLLTRLCLATLLALSGASLAQAADSAATPATANATATATAATTPLVPAAAPRLAHIDVSPVPARRIASPLKTGWEKGAFMEIFVRAFADGDGDGVGDLKGLTQRLDDLKDLGVTGLWLMPITRNADGDHGYATSDYRSIAPEYGTLADFDELIKQAHARGIGVVMDYVVNHSAAQFPPFMDAAKNPASPWRKWFVFSDTEPKGWDIWGKNPWYLTAAEHWNSKLEPKDLPPAPPGSRDFYFGTFGPHMPDFNLRNPAVVAYHEDSLRFWLNRGLDGFRLDAVPHLIERDAVAWNDQPESRALTLRLAKLIRSYDKRWVVCEATAKPESWAAPNVCGSAFAFGYVENYVKAAKGDTAAVEKLASFWRTAPKGMSTMVHNHDIFAGDRLWDQLQGDETRYKLVAATYLLQPGTPFIYFGEDIGLAGALGVTGDLPLRSPMSWTSDPRTAGFTTGTPFRPLAPNLARQNVASQKADPDSIRSFYKAMLSLRNGHPSIARGSFEHSFAKGHVLGFQRALGNERTLVVINYGASTTVKVPGLSSKAQLVSLFPAVGSAETASKATGSIDLPAQSVQVWRIK